MCVVQAVTVVLGKAGSILNRGVRWAQVAPSNED